MTNIFRSDFSGDRELILGTLLPALVARDPESAARAVLDIGDEDLRLEALDRLGRLWAARDPQAALGWAGLLSFRDEREAVVTGACLQLTAESVPLAIDTLASCVPGDRPVGAIEDLAQRWAESDLTNACRWSLALEPGPRRDGLVARLAYVQAKTAPAAAAALALRELPEGETRNESVISVIDQWARRDPSGARRWVEGFAPGPFRERALRELRATAGLGNLRFPP